jgi:hypothetical protein
LKLQAVGNPAIIAGAGTARRRRMREMLVPIFGESGAAVAQFLIILVIVLVLVGGVVWLVRRYGNGAFGGVSRNRVPRLALVDALAVDGRRRLVLVRRDHVEHLILIGGPTDVVVEPVIVRGVSMGARQRQGQVARPAQPGQSSNGAPQPAGPPLVEPAPPPPPVDLPPPPVAMMPAPRPAPVPPPARPALPPASARPAPAPPPPAPRRAVVQPGESASVPPAAPPPPRDLEPDAEPLPSILRRPMPANAGRPASGHFAETSRPTRIESVLALADALDDIADEPAAAPAAPFEPARNAPPVPSASASAVAAPAGEVGDEPLPEYLALAEEEPAPATAAEEIAEGPPAAPASSSNVSDLEREMARLLGEITAKRGG